MAHPAPRAGCFFSTVIFCTHPVLVISLQWTTNTCTDMKKYIFLLLILISAVTAKSQDYLGGTIGFEYVRAGDECPASFIISPEVGHYFSNRVAVGVTVPVSITTGLSSISILPYVHYDFARVSIVDFFGELTIGWNRLSFEGDAINGLHAALRPGIKINLSKKFSLLARTALLSLNCYKDSDAIVGFAINNGFELGFAVNL